MILRYFQRGFNYSQDGPGNRLVYHLQGCNMRCPWCSNPEGMEMAKAATEQSTDDVVREIVSSQMMFFEGGGVTFTGGEATLQFDAIYDIMKRVKEHGISTAIETNATHRRLPELLTVCDHWMVDFKHPSPSELKRWTGAGGEIVFDNLKQLTQHTFVHIRIPLIHRFNDDADTLSAFVDRFKDLQAAGGRFDIELLPYHEYGKDKWAACQKPYTVTDGFVSEQAVADFEHRLTNHAIPPVHT